MKTSQFVLLLAVLVIGQIVGFGLVLGKLQAPESSTNSQQSHPEFRPLRR